MRQCGSKRESGRDGDTCEESPIDVHTKVGEPAAVANVVPNTRTVAGKALTANVALVKADVGLGNVDNTSDANKPVSTAQAAAINAKVGSEYVPIDVSHALG